MIGIVKSVIWHFTLEINVVAVAAAVACFESPSCNYIIDLQGYFTNSINFKAEKNYLYYWTEASDLNFYEKPIQT